MRLVWKLLRRHVSVLQLTGFFLTNLVGVAIILTAVQLYRDVRPLVEAPDSFLSNDFLVLTKEVGQVAVGGTFFMRAELDSLAAQPFVESVGEFASARYSVVGGISFGGAGFQTYMFFESVPDRFLDVESDRWQFADGDRLIPIILPRNYLNLYNFGFASTQGLPQVTEDLVQKVVMDIDVTGGGYRESFKGQIVAFSNRLNTILVPESFMEWSNARFADKPAADPSRVIIEVRNTADEAMAAYLTAHGYRIEGDNQSGGRASYFLRMAAGIVGGVGLLITVLSFFILMLSIFLLLQKNARKLEDLLLVGYTSAQVSRPYQMLTLGLNLLAVLCVIPVVACLRAKYITLAATFTETEIETGIFPTLLIGIALALGVTIVNAIAIRRKVDSLRVQD